MSRRTAQNLLLILGGLLLAVAAIVFTVVSWGHLGIGGRAAILAGLTGVTLAVPVVLLRRKLNATAETVGALGLALMLLDGYAAHRTGLVGAVDGWDYAAATLGVVALAAAVYGRVLSLKVSLSLAVVLAQAPLIMLATGHGRGWPSAALAATVVLDIAVWSVAARWGALRVTAVVCAAIMGTAALVSAGVATAEQDWLLHVPSLLVLAAMGFFAAFRTEDRIGRAFAAGWSATALVVAVGAPGLGLPAADWRVPPYVGAALAVTALARLLPERLRAPYAFSGVGLALLGGLAVLPQTLMAVFDAPVTTLWDDDVVVGPPAAPVVFALLAAVPLVLGRARWAAVVPATAAVVAAPVVYGLPYLVVVGVQLAVALGFTVVAARFRVPSAPWVAGVVGALAVLWSLDQRPVAYAVLGALLVAWGLLYRRPAALVGAALAGSGLVWVALDGLGLFARDAASTGLAIGAGLALLGWYGTRATPGPPGIERTPSERTPSEGGPAAAIPGGGSSVATSERGPAVVPSERGPGAVTSRGGPGVATSVVGRVTVVLAALALVVVGDVLVGTFGAYLAVFDPWRGGVAFTGDRPLAVVAVGLAGVVLALAVRPGLVALAGVLVVAVVPVAVRVPYVVVLVVMVVATTGAAWAAARGRSGRVGRAAGTAGALWLGSLVLGWALADETATLAVFPALATVAATTALLWRPNPSTTHPRPHPERPARTRPEETAHARATETAQAHPEEAARQRPEETARPRAEEWVHARPHRVGPGVRVGEGARFWWAVLAGVLVAGEVVAVAAALEVRVLEAYTLPFAALTLAVGGWRARGTALSSWLAYGPGLALAFGPSLLQEATPLRAFALGAAALAVTLAGAWRRLQAPALMGGVTVAIVAVRELAPWIADLMGAVPRWVPMALGGLLLLVVGATYEARKRDVRRLRDAVARLR
ncbi:hypothetical protein GCM10010404_67450 [Nonomuraea africana]|uniref:DUF2339 domain-containing protein n=1 Tax=Nonomuraea africana TaxID=46171 RepID=A0ABR9KP01_9ACTN|nr:hypothetical protein [Nonomuraea africana]MBE1563753.1 hypothetical protein [Nonomuraea africana]